MSETKALPLATRAAANALRAKLRTALGLPRTATEADRIGGGIHVPLDRCVTTEAVGIDELVDGSFEARVPADFERHLSAAERTRLRTSTVREVSALEAVRLEAPAADEPSAPSPR